MDAYELNLDLATVTIAQPNRDAVDFDPLGRWLLETGGTTQVPADWLKHWPSRAVAPPQVSEPTAWINASGYCVSQKVKETIEELAPSVHQFIPLILEAGSQANRREHPYFSLHVADRADEVDVEKSDVNWREMKGVRYWTKKMSSPIALPAVSISGKQIWWNRRVNILLISGDLHDQLVIRGLATGLSLQKQIVV